MQLVSVIMPVRNEDGYIANSLNAVLEQDYPSERMEIIVVDGMSTDGTREIIRVIQTNNPQVQLIDNPEWIVPTGMNAALAIARGEIVVRIDGHCEIERDYVRRCVEHLINDGVDGVGGSLDTIGETDVSRVIAVAMSSKFGVGNSAFRTVCDKTMLTDTVAFPAYTRDIIDRVGPYDEELVRNQDDDYNYRMRKIGAKILLAADVRSRYYSRGTIGKLWRQYFQYGYWKVRVMQKHPAQMRPRQFVPPLFAVTLLLSFSSGLISSIGALVFGLVIGLYAIVNLTCSFLVVRERRPQLYWLLPVAFATLHLGYGFGFLVGLVKFWNRWGDHEGKQIKSGIPRPIEAVVALIGLVIFAPIIAIALIAIAVSSRGPVIFRQPRMGRKGRTFVLYKMRTMRPAGTGPQVTAGDDSRITPVGKLLRRTKLDELPELWNIVRGDMSIVGPRPEVSRYVDLQNPLWYQVLEARPGLTDPMTLRLRNEEELMAEVRGDREKFYRETLLPFKLNGYLSYLQRRSWVSDLMVIWQTIVAVLIPNSAPLPTLEEIQSFANKKSAV